MVVSVIFWGNLFPNAPLANAPPGLIEKLLLGAALLLLLFLAFAVVMTRYLRRRTERAIEDLITNADALTQRENA